MTTLEFIKKKNEIIRNHCGVTLIPEAQMIDLPKVKLTMEMDREACPYCVMFLRNQCRECPMFLAGNDCHEPHSTYAEMCDVVGDKDMVGKSTPWHKELSELIQSYNES